MGSRISTPLFDQPDKNYMCIALGNLNSIVLLYPDEDVINTVRNAIASTWIKKIKKEEYLYMDDDETIKNCYKFEIGGYPLQSDSLTTREKSISIRSMSSAILQSLYMKGWKLLVSSDLSRNSDVTTWFFQRQHIFPDNSLMFSIGLSSVDKLQINGCPANLHGMIKDICQRTWVNGIRREEAIENSYEIMLNDTPWSRVTKAQSCSSRLMLKNIIQELHSQHYALYGNSNLKGTADTMFFQYNPSLQEEGDFIVVSLNEDDRLRLIATPLPIINAIKSVVESCWPRGLRSIKQDDSCCELHLKGYPWKSSGHDAVLSRLLIAKIMEMLASLGYFVISALDMTRKPGDKAVFMFQRGLSLRTSFMCVSLNDSDGMKFINGPQNLVEAGREVLRHWPSGLRKEKTSPDGVSYEAELKGLPWEQMTYGNGLHARALLLLLLCNFTSLGWRLVCSADVSSKYYKSKDSPARPIDAHSWYFMYDEMMLSQIQAQ